MSQYFGSRVDSKRMSVPEGAGYVPQRRREGYVASSVSVVTESSKVQSRLNEPIFWLFDIYSLLREATSHLYLKV